MASTRHRGDLSPICLKPNVAANRAKIVSTLPYYTAKPNSRCAKGAEIQTTYECKKALNKLRLGKVRTFN